MSRDILQKKKDKMATLGLPSWLNQNCPCCGDMMPSSSLLGFGVEMSPKTFGNVSTTYVCPHCSSLVELHYIRGLVDSVDLASFLADAEQPSEPVTYEQITMSKGHNLDDED